MLIRVGLPYMGGQMSQAAAGLPVLVSAGSLWQAREGRPHGWLRVPLPAWEHCPALDSAGFTAMKLGGYRWTVEEYVEFIATTGGYSEGRPSPWAWWSAMDYCCEQEIASDRPEVERRMRLTVDTFGETLRVCEDWRREGVTDLPDPVPVLQGRTPADYLWSARELARAIDEHHACRCPELAPDDDGCPAEWHRSHAGLPALVGVGSVCRREVGGPEGLFPVVEALHRKLPRHVRLHLFGVKGPALGRLSEYGNRIASVDSMAWDRGVRWKPGASKMAKRAAAMEEWLSVNDERARQPQRGLFGHY